MNKFDLKDIQSKFNQVVKYSQHLSGEVNSDALFKDWRANKSVFIDAWDGQLIKELGEATFHLSEEQRAKAVSNVVDQIDYLYRESGLGYPDFRLDDLIAFILENQDNFFDNIVNEDFHVDDISVPKGMKILRAFKYFCKDKELLNEIQSVASMAIQNDKVTGILCMSVHPLDYLSVSENAHNWRSCHALDGEYRAGNLNYMADSSTVVCYLRSTHKTELPRFPEDIKWNSKKWRVLLFFDETYDFMMAGRQYPFFENSLLLPIKKEVERMFNRRFSGWCDEYIKSTQLHSFLEEEDRSNRYEAYYTQKYLPASGRLLRLKKLVQNGEGTLQFNDLLESSTYEEPYYSFALDRGWMGDYYNSQIHTNIIPKIQVGKKCTCLECNKEDITMSEAFLCKHCMLKENQVDDHDEFRTCYYCGQIYLVDEGGYMNDEYGMSHDTCPECLRDYMVHCEYCGEPYDENALEDGLCPSCRRSENDQNERFNHIHIIEPISMQMRDRETNEIIAEWADVREANIF